MTLLLQVPAGTPPSADTLRRTPADVGASAGASFIPAKDAPAGRELLKRAIRDWTYEQVFARFSRIPAPLPFTERQILTRLREVDALPTNQSRMDRRLDLETDMNMLDRELRRPASKLKDRDPRRQRLQSVWDYITTAMERTRLMVGDRERRLRFNVGVFFRSDLPPAYLTDFATSTNWEIAALALGHNAEGQRLIHQITGHPAEAITEDAFLAAKGSLQNVDKAFRSYNSRILNLASTSDEVLATREALEFYVDLFTAPDLQAVRRAHPVSMSRLDRGVLEELVEAVRNATDQLRRALAMEYPAGLSSFQWTPQDNPLLAALIRLELEPTSAG